ncbi:hypothetical protein NOCARDAX2BIS_360001 [Nocardioides sp. AX2bis]|nr:hypothetical protein NOCARDAX2BIS_360001 [Nocardioides sp. AX2bis]
MAAGGRSPRPSVPHPTLALAMEEIPLEGTIALRTLARFVDLATDALGSAREEIDALNVYPVPDGDTGTNLHLTVSAARDGLTAALEADAGREAALAALARGALLGARGNSGVVLSEMLGEVVRRIGRARVDERGAVVMAEALARAAEAAYAAVGTPVEGTMLSVARAAADAAVERATDPAARTGEVVTAAAAAARAALARTPEQLDVLAHAGVVDAGGRGLCVLLDAAETASTGRRGGPARGRPVLRGDVPPRRPSRSRSAGTAAAGRAGRLARGGGRRGPVERPRPRRRRRRRRRGRDRGRSPPPGPGHPLRRAGRRPPHPARARPGPCRPRGGRGRRRSRPGPSLHRGRGHGGPGRPRPPALQRRGARGDHRVRGGRGGGARQRRRRGPGGPRRRRGRRGRLRPARRGHPDRGAGAGPGRHGRARARPLLRPRRRGDDRHGAPRAARRRDGGHRAGDDHGRALRAGRRPRHGGGRLRRGGRRRPRRGDRRARAPAGRGWRAGHGGGRRTHGRAARPRAAHRGVAGLRAPRGRPGRLRRRPGPVRADAGGGVSVRAVRAGRGRRTR